MKLSSLGKRPAFTMTQLNVCASAFLVLFCNFSFFQKVFRVYPLTLSNVPFLISLAVLVGALHMLLLSLVSSRWTIKPCLVLLFMVSSMTAFFMDHYSVVVDQVMILNVMETDSAEVADLMSPGLGLYILLLGVLPSSVVCLIRLEPASWKKAAMVKVRDISLSLLVVLLMLLPFGGFYASFFREHKPLRYASNPMSFLYSTAKALTESGPRGNEPKAPIGTDARIPDTDSDRELIILVIGESARADRFSLNGYARQTNPLLEREDVISLTQMYACGTSTAVSVPCMFSLLPQSSFTVKKGAASENLLDVLKRAGVHILWRDNNSSSKGVALSVPHENYRDPEINPVCDVECRDVGMLAGLQDYIDRIPEGDILIVLHQMGNHGPAYYKRYPASFERFTPVCRTNQLEQCSEEQIGNAYDNALLYTDYFLAQVIAFLKGNSGPFETAMFYVSDHGESLGEYGLYLHGFPYRIAPDAQTHVACVLWFGRGFKVDREDVRKRAHRPYSHDNIFHTILDMLEIETSVYDADLDILRNE